MKVLFELDERNLEYGFPGRTWAHMYSFFFPSPRLNANLLQRSEVVALINTLHRFSESLHAVDVFRGLWRETSAEESAKLIQEAEKAVRIPVGYSGQHCSSYSNIFFSYSGHPHLSVQTLRQLPAWSKRSSNERHFGYASARRARLSVWAR
jgi:hypothetical protein